MSEALRNKETDQISPYEAVLRSFGYHERRTTEEHARTRADLERSVQLAPGYADGWAVLSIICSEEYANGFNLKPDPLGRGLEAARRAADAARRQRGSWAACALNAFSYTFSTISIATSPLACTPI